MLKVTVEYNGITASHTDDFWKNYPYRPEKLERLVKMAYEDVIRKKLAQSPNS